MRVCVLEKEVAGDGASGRNGGWCSAYFASPREKLARECGRAAAVAQQGAMFETVKEVGRVCEAEAIAADFHQGGNLVFATNAAQQANIRADIEYEHSWGFGEEEFRWLSRDEARARIPIEGALGAWYTPHCASVHPAKLVRGLAKVVEGLGVPIYEHTAVLNRVPHGVRTAAGLVRAEIVVRATEGYTVDLPGLRRARFRLHPRRLPRSRFQTISGASWDGAAASAGTMVVTSSSMLLVPQMDASPWVGVARRITWARA